MRHSLLLRLLSGVAIAASIALASPLAAYAEDKPAAAAAEETPFDPLDVNTFSGDTENPATGATLLEDANAWRRKEVNLYGKTFSIG